MDPSALLQSARSAGIMIVVGLSVLSLVESIIPLRARGRAGRLHLRPNLALASLTFATGLIFNTALVVVLSIAQRAGFGPLHAFEWPAGAAIVVAVAVLDFSTYLAHVSMHHVPAFWRFHRVHHADPAVDVTTTLRQHPGESVIRFAFLAAFAIASGASPVAFGLYRLASLGIGLVEHANVRLPLGLDTAIALAVTSPNMHKVHHSREPIETDSNYGNILTLFDRLFGTFTPPTRGVEVNCGLAGFDDDETQRVGALLRLPFRPATRRVHCSTISTAEATAFARRKT